MNKITNLVKTDNLDRVKELHRQAETCYHQGDLKKAIALCQEAIKLQPDFALIYKTLGMIFQSRGQVHPAIRCYQKAVEIDREAIAVEIFLTLGNHFAEKGQIDEAIQTYQIALQFQPDYAEAHYNIGVMQRQKGDLNAAIASYEQAIAIDPKLAMAYFSLGNVLLEQKQWDRAIAAYIDTLLIQPQFERVYLCLWKAFAQKGRIEEALSCALHILTLEAIAEFYPSSVQFSLTSKSANPDSVKFIDVHPKTPVRLVKPKTPDGRFHPYFKWDIYNNPETFVATIPNGRVWGDAHTTTVSTGDDRFMDELCQGSSGLIALSEKLPTPTELDGTVAFLTVRGGRTYYHWMADLLPRIQLLRLANIDFNEIDYFIVNSKDIAFQRDTLGALGIPSYKIIESLKLPHVKAKNLVVPSLPGDVGLIAQWTCHFLRDAFLSNPTRISEKTSERVYISRDRASYRRVVNEDRLMKMLSQYGFVRVALEDLSFAEQVSLFAGAKAIVAPHGAGLTNAIFCNPGTKLLEIFSPDAVSVNYWLVSNIIGLEYYYLLGDSLEEYYAQTQQQRQGYTHPLYEDIFVKDERVVQMMEFAGII